MTPEKLLTKEEIAALLGVRPRTVWDWYAQKKFPGVHVGSRVRFYWSVVERSVVKKVKP